MAFFSMWMDLLVFNKIRTESHQFVGQSYMEDQWTYGQILTVTTWFPVCGECLRLLVCKSSESRGVSYTIPPWIEWQPQKKHIKLICIF